MILGREIPPLVVRQLRLWDRLKPVKRSLDSPLNLKNRES